MRKPISRKPAKKKAFFPRPKSLHTIRIRQLIKAGKSNPEIFRIVSQEFPSATRDTIRASTSYLRRKLEKLKKKVKPIPKAKQPYTKRIEELLLKKKNITNKELVGVIAREFKKKKLSPELIYASIGRARRRHKIPAPSQLPQDIQIARKMAVKTKKSPKEVFDFLKGKGLLTSSKAAIYSQYYRAKREAGIRPHAVPAPKYLPSAEEIKKRTEEIVKERREKGKPKKKTRLQQRIEFMERKTRRRKPKRR